MLIGAAVKEASTRSVALQPLFSLYSYHGPVFRYCWQHVIITGMHVLLSLKHLLVCCSSHDCFHEVLLSAADCPSAMLFGMFGVDCVTAQGAAAS